MSHQVITRMAYNAKTKQIETWQHSNNVWPTTDHFYALDVKTDEQMFEFITLIANGLWQGRKWRKAFKTLFEEYPELVRSSYEHELRGQPWKAYCAICKKYEELAQSKCNEIVARFKQTNRADGFRPVAQGRQDRFRIETRTVYAAWHKHISWHR